MLGWVTFILVLLILCRISGEQSVHTVVRETPVPLAGAGGTTEADLQLAIQEAAWKHEQRKKSLEFWRGIQFGHRFEERTRQCVCGLTQIEYHRCRVSFGTEVCEAFIREHECGSRP